MRARSLRLVALLLGASCSSVAAGPFTGFIAAPGCADLDADAARDGELIAMLPRTPGLPSLPHDDFLFDLRTKGGAAINGTWLLPDDYESYGDWLSAPDPSAVWAVRIALPPAAPGAPGRVALDTGKPATIDLGVIVPLEIGNSLPVGVDAGIGLVIPGDGSTYPVDFGQATATFPQRGADGSVTIAFAPLAELNTTELVPGACTVAGPHEDPRSGRSGRGFIRGYNVYRLPAGAGPAGAAEFTAALTDGDPTTGFQAFIDLDSYDVNVPTDVLANPAANDRDPSDFASLHNPDGRMYSGDEVIVWTDAAASSGRAHPERAPAGDLGYRYAVQPVSMGDFDGSESCFSVNCLFDGVHVRDLDGNGSPDAVNLDSTDPADLEVEFISPQADPAEGGRGGLGLTWRSQLLLSSTSGATALPPDVLRRSTEVTALRPLSPALATILPLGPEDVIVTPFASGDVDPDPTIIESRTHPLVFYDVPGRDIRLDITGAPGSRRVRVTF